MAQIGTFTRDENGACLQNFAPTTNKRKHSATLKSAPNRIPSYQVHQRRVSNRVIVSRRNQLSFSSV